MPGTVEHRRCSSDQNWIPHGACILVDGLELPQEPHREGKVLARCPTAWAGLTPSCWLPGLGLHFPLSSGAVGGTPINHTLPQPLVPERQEDAKGRSQVALGVAGLRAHSPKAVPALPPKCRGMGTETSLLILGRGASVGVPSRCPALAGRGAFGLGGGRRAPFVSETSG